MIIGISGYIGVGKDEVAKMIQFLTSVKEEHRTFEVYQRGKWKGWDMITGRWKRQWEIKKFAGKLKQIVSLLTGIPIADLEKQSVKESILGPEWSEIGLLHSNPLAQMSVRTMLQRTGTDAMRDRVHQNIWVNALFVDYRGVKTGQRVVKENGYPVDFHKYFDMPNWIISDLRFPNELKAIKDRDGICIRIDRPHNKVYGSPIREGDKIRFEEVIKHPSETALDNAEFDYTIQNSGTLEELLEQVRTMLLHFKIIT